MNANPNTINQRVEQMRQAMQRHGINAFIVPGSDAHLGEYTPERWTGRRYMSGFTGSAGTVVITAHKAGLWTDSRYFLQGARQLEGTVVALFKDGEPETPSITRFLIDELPAGSVVAWDSACYSVREAEELTEQLANFGIQTAAADLLNEIWTNRPDVPANPFFEHPLEYAGEATDERIARIRQEISRHGAKAIVLTMLDELCWAFNIRSCDVAFNPVGVGYGFIGEHEAVLFTLPEKVPAPLRASLEAKGISVRAYEEFIPYLAQAAATGVKVFVDKGRTSQLAFETLRDGGAAFVWGTSPVTLMKSVKNSAEIAGIKRAMVRDGVALTRFFIWLKDALARKEKISEYDAGIRLTAFRAQQEKYVSDSFDTICGYKGNGAIVHYRAEKETANLLEPEGILLLDSGAQYLDGTTDITRTFALGNTTEQQRRDYTLVLKGHIALARARFPQGTRGNQLDILARKPLWDLGLSYGHGTGHGVGVFMNVHEGPQNFRTDNNPSEMLLHTFTSDEPGLYRTGEYGIRIENLILTVEKEKTEFGTFYGFETLTLCCLDNRLVVPDMLTKEETEWYNAYQETVYQTLKDALSPEEAAWLREETKPLR